MRDVRKLLSEYDLPSEAKTLEVSVRLLEELEAGGYTSPKIAERIRKRFGLTKEETEQLISPNHKPLDMKRIGNAQRKTTIIRKPDLATCEYYNYKREKFIRKDKAR